MASPLDFFFARPPEEGADRLDLLFAIPTILSKWLIKKNFYFLVDLAVGFSKHIE